MSMSKQRSWDAFRAESDGAVHREHYPAGGFTQPVRVVAWPEGAPPQEEVPHAGARVTDGAAVGVVISGIPYRLFSDGDWQMDVWVDDSVYAMDIDDLRPLPEKRTASGEVVGEFHVHAAGNFSTSALPSDGGTYTIIREDT